MEKSVKEKFDSYPAEAREKLVEIRALIFAVAADDDCGEIVEALKWGEPSYASKISSPLRIDWKPKSPEHVSIFVNCKTNLIETFKEVYGGVLEYVGNREILLSLTKPLPIPVLRGCISMALRYHKLKKLPLLGA